jgi:hypothetical protein
MARERFQMPFEGFAIKSVSAPTDVFIDHFCRTEKGADDLSLLNFLLFCHVILLWISCAVQGCSFYHAYRCEKNKIHSCNLWPLAYSHTPAEGRQIFDFSNGETMEITTEITEFNPFLLADSCELKHDDDDFDDDFDEDDDFDDYDDEDDDDDFDDEDDDDDDFDFDGFDDDDEDEDDEDDDDEDEDEERYDRYGFGIYGDDDEEEDEDEDGEDEEDRW